MQPNLKKILRALSLDIRHTLEGSYDAAGVFHPGDMETRLNELGVWRERPARTLPELPHLSAEDRAARQVIDAYIAYRAEAGVERAEAVAEFVREAAYNWANRLLALRCMEARGIIDEVVLQKAVYGGRSMVHNRLAKKDPEACVGPDEGLFAVLLMEFQARAEELPELFAPNSPAIALRPSLPALKRVVGLLSGTLRANGQEPATDEVFSAPDALGWAYQYWNSEEKDRVFEKVRTQKGAKIEGADIVPATQLYTEPYMVKFLVQNSLGALWMGMHPGSTLAEGWEYYVKDADRAPVECKTAQEVTLLDPACGSGHFLLEAFDLLFQMYQEEDASWTEAEIASAILNHNLYGIDIDERAVQIASAALWMKAKEVSSDLSPAALSSFHHHLVATNIRLPKGKDHLKVFLATYPDSAPLQTALEAIFEGLENVHELGSLVQVEEPVEKELRYLREKYESAKKKGIQPNFFELVTVQGELPLGVESYEQWKADTLAHLEQHFIEESETSDAVHSFFSQSAKKGLALFEALSQRYDVLTANPPYMGSKNMGDITRKYLAKFFSYGKRDLYASFIIRCGQMAKSQGFISMVTMNKWLFQSLYSDFRTDTIIDFKKLEVVADLGSRAFDPENKFHDGVQVALFIMRTCPPNGSSQFTAINATNVEGPINKDHLIKNEILRPSDLSNSHNQRRFKSIPGYPILLNLSPNALQIFNSKKRLNDIAKARQGLASSNNSRYLRCFWEVSNPKRWVSYYKGGGYKKWYGLNWLLIDWQANGLAVKQYARSLYGSETRTIKNQEFYFKPCITYTQTGAGCMGARIVKPSVFDVKGICVFPNEGTTSLYFLMALLSTHSSSLLLRVLTQSLEFHSGYVDLMPIGNSFDYYEKLKSIGEACAFLKKKLVDNDLTEISFSGIKNLLSDLEVSALLHTLEGQLETYVSNALGLKGDLLEWLIKETGMPVGWYSLIEGYDLLPSLQPDEKEDINKIDLDISVINRVKIDKSDLKFLKENLRRIFEASEQTEKQNLDIEDHEEENESETSVSRIPIPAETLLERISMELRVHPLSVYWLLKEGIEVDGWTSNPEKRRRFINSLSVIVLHLLGYRWPKQIEAEESVLAWADPDGIIPLTPGLRDLPLIERVRVRLPEQFPGGNVTALEHEFAEIIGEPLEKWLSGSFFKHHISQFKKRPIAWQLTSQPANSKGGKGKAKKGLDKAPAFSCLVYYHKLNAGTLTTIKSQYVSPLHQSYETELRTLEGIVLLSPEQSSRRLQLEAWIDELKEFEDRLERCAREGFASPALAKVGAKESLDRWVSRDGIAKPPANRTEFEAQEMRYDPDLNDGVRVNISPLQKFGLLAADVLDAKDIEKAIADRAEWRADERRWCREGKLPKPGWWK